MGFRTSVGGDMRLSQLQVKNWRNFHEIEFLLGQRLIIVGANAMTESKSHGCLPISRDLASPKEDWARQSTVVVD